MMFHKLSPNLSPLIIGGTGYIGSHLSHALLQHGYNPIVLGRSKVYDLFFDLSNPEGIPPDLVSERVVVHLATGIVPSLFSVSNLDLVHSELRSFSQLLSHLNTHGCKRFVYISSGGCIYGPSSSTLINEEHPTRPINLYGYLKLGCESILSMFRNDHDMDVVSLRPSNCYGPFQKVRKGQGVIPSFIQSIRNSEPITLFGDGSVERDYIYIEDLVNAIIKVIDIPTLPSWIFNLSTGRTHSLKFILRQLEDLSSMPILINSKPSRSFDAPCIGLNSSSLQKAILWKPKTSFTDGLAEQWRASGL